MRSNAGRHTRLPAGEAMTFMPTEDKPVSLSTILIMFWAIGLFTGVLLAYVVVEML